MSKKNNTLKRDKSLKVECAGEEEISPKKLRLNHNPSTDGKEPSTDGAQPSTEGHDETSITTMDCIEYIQKSQIKCLKLQVKQLSEAVASEKSSSKAQTVQLEIVNKKLIKMESEIKQLTEEKEEQLKKNTELQQKYTKNYKKIVETEILFDEKYTALKETKKSLEKSNQDLQEKIDYLEKAIIAMDSHMDEFKSKVLAQRDACMSEAQAQMSQVEQQLRANYDALLSENKASYEETLLEKNEIIKTLEARNHELINKYENLNHTHQAQQLKMTEVERALNKRVHHVQADQHTVKTEVPPMSCQVMPLNTQENNLPSTSREVNNSEASQLVDTNISQIQTSLGSGNMITRSKRKHRQSVGKSFTDYRKSRSRLTTIHTQDQNAVAATSTDDDSDFSCWVPNDPYKDFVAPARPLTNTRLPPTNNFIPETSDSERNKE